MGEQTCHFTMIYYHLLQTIIRLHFPKISFPESPRGDEAPQRRAGVDVDQARRSSSSDMMMPYHRVATLRHPSPTISFKATTSR